MKAEKAAKEEAGKEKRRQYVKRVARNKIRNKSKARKGEKEEGLGIGEGEFICAFRLT